MLVGVKEYVTKYCEVKSRRGKPLSEGYLYRLIRTHIKGLPCRELWFEYVLEGEKDRIWIEVEGETL